MEKETRAKLDIYFQGEFTQEEIYNKLTEILKDTPFQLYEIEIQEN